MNQLAIVIPYYKINFFEETLKSVAAQTNKNFTLYIGNDSSPDNPFPVIQKNFQEGEYKYFEYKDNLGSKNLALQWERILENVTEDWFQILGDDDTISANFADEFYENLPLANQQNTNVLKFSQCFINEAGERINEFTHYPKIASSKLIWRSKYVEKHRSSLSEHVFRTKTYRKYKFKPFPLAWYSDDLAVLEFSEANEIIFINAAKVYVRMSAVNISSLTNNEQEKERAKQQYLEIILNTYFYLFDKEELKKEFNDYLYITWKNKYPSKLNFLPIYLKMKPWYKILKIPYQKSLLNKNARIK